MFPLDNILIHKLHIEGRFKFQSFIRFPSSRMRHNGLGICSRRISIRISSCFMRLGSIQGDKTCRPHPLGIRRTHKQGDKRDICYYLGCSMSRFWFWFPVNSRYKLRIRFYKGGRLHSQIYCKEDMIRLINMCLVCILLL